MICIKMKGALCAESFCDYWDLEQKECSFALVQKKKLELIDIIIKKVKTSNKIENKNLQQILEISETLH